MFSYEYTYIKWGICERDWMLCVCVCMLAPQLTRPDLIKSRSLGEVFVLIMSKVCIVCKFIKSVVNAMFFMNRTRICSVFLDSMFVQQVSHMCHKGKFIHEMLYLVPSRTKRGCQDLEIRASWVSTSRQKTRREPQAKTLGLEMIGSVKLKKMPITKGI